jgi:hypothetical protein
MDEINIDGCSRHSLTYASTTSLECGEAERTYEKGRQHGCEYDSIIVPECICSEYKMA